MKKMIRYIAISMTVVGLTMAYVPNSFAAVTFDDLNEQEKLQASSIADALLYHGEDHAFECLKAYMPSNNVVQVCIDKGAFPNHMDELKALYPNLDYSGGSQTEKTEQQTLEETPAPEPAAFTVEDMPETPMWAISEVNCRDGASTDYAKIGSLKANEKVIVNGKASTGWYRFVLADGTEAYVSDKYLTNEDPDAAVEPEPGPEPEETVPAAELEPESEQEPMAETPEPAAEEQEPVAETPEPAVEEQEPVAEAPEPAAEDPGPTAEPPVVEDEAAGSWIPIAAGAAFLCVIGIAAAVLIKRKKN